MNAPPAVANLFDLAGVSPAAEDFAPLVARPGLRIERIVSHGQATPEGEWLEEPYAEWAVLLCGRAGLRFEGADEPLALKPGDHLLIEAGRRHRVEWTDPSQPTVWLAVHHA
ncbi:cupin domain-containing protein [Methylocella sp.]|uniref:cupin domain-containing protein n=1 Tax=Methylocella sp. TaxID=1978226 RepID=UPI003783E381